MPVGIAHFGRQHALHLLYVVLRTPETAACHVYFLFFPHQFGIVSVAFLLHLVERNEAQRCTVYAVAQPTPVCRTVVEHVSKVRIARLAPYFGALHAVRIVGFLHQELLVYRLGEGWPAAPRIVFVGGREQRFARGNVYIDARAELLVVLVGVRTFGCSLLRNGVLLGCELATQRFVAGSRKCFLCHFCCFNSCIVVFMGG